MSKRKRELSDEQLVKRCLAGEPDAWTELRQRHLEELTEHIRYLLHGQGNVQYRAEDIAEDVLTSLFEKKMARLRYFKPAQASFRAYLRVLALQAVQLEHRKTRRRRKIQREAADRAHAASWVDDAAAALLQKEFIATLPPREQAYCRHVLLGEPDPSGQHKFSATQGYKLRERILKKAKDFCKRNGGG